MNPLDPFGLGFLSNSTGWTGDPSQLGNRQAAGMQNHNPYCHRANLYACATQYMSDMSAIHAMLADRAIPQAVLKFRGSKYAPRAL